MSLMEIEHRPTSRVERKRLEARSRILSAAEQLMRAKGFDAVKIQEITDTADVGHGTFYTHFKTKMDVLVPILRTKAHGLTEQLDNLTRDMKDPAEVVSISVRHLLTAIANDPLWSWFLFKSDLPMEQIREATGESAKRDIQMGVDTGRFIDHDGGTLEPFLLGALAGVIRDKFEEGLNQKTIENSAHILLLILGVQNDEALTLSRTQLPPLAEN
jgi:AcrR family transcriptional regulator